MGLMAPCRGDRGRSLGPSHHTSNLPSDAVRETGVLGPVGQRSQGVHTDGAFDGEECIRLDRGRGGVQGSQAPACRPGRGVMRVFPLLKHGGGLGCEDS